MKISKKRGFISLAIVLMFLLSCLPLAAFANNTEKETISNVEQTQTEKTTQTTEKATEKTNDSEKTTKNTENTVVEEKKSFQKPVSFNFEDLKSEKSSEKKTGDLAISPRAISPALKHFQWGSAPSVKGTLKNAQVKEIGGTKYASGVLPAGTDDEYISMKFDARTLADAQDKPLTNYMGFEDGYLGASGYGGGQGKVFIDNQSDFDYEIVGMEFDPTTNNLIDEVNATWTNKMFEEVKTNSRYQTYYQKYQTNIDNKVSPSTSELIELNGMYNEDGVGGYDLLIGDTYTVDGVFDIATASKEMFGGSAHISGARSDGGHLFYDVARHRMEAMTFAKIGSETSEYIAGKPEYSVAKYTTRTAEVQQGILDQITNKQVSKEGVYELPIHVDTSAAMSTNAFNNWYIRSDVAFQIILKRIPKPVVKITYHGNNNTSGSVPIDSNEYTINTSATVLAKGDLAKEGYKFVGWNTLSDGSGDRYNAGDQILLPYNIDLYAEWEQEKYKLNYNGNGNTSGELPVDNTDYLFGENAAVAPAGNLVRDGYSFVNWNTKADGSGIAFSPNSSVSMTQHYTLYAQWRANQVPVNRFTLNYMGNGNTTGTVPNGGTYDEGSVVLIAGAGNMAREGFRFVNWNTQVNGNGQAYSANSTITLNQNITLYAQWAEVTVPEPPVTPTQPTTPTPPATSVIPGAPATPPRMFMDSILEDAAAAPDVEESPEEVIDDGTTPLAGKENSWALVNLILTVVGMIVAVVLFVGIFINKKKTEKTKFYKDNNDVVYSQEEQNRKSKSMIWRILAIVTAVVSLIVFIITEDMSLPMAMTDKWTLLMVILLAFEGLFTAIMYITRNNKKDDDIEKQDALPIN